ncbi:MAG TPA: helix-turn-helix transcriptional regulator [Bacteroidales bacterium]|nr:helix-turn-helix transcriptional regulator [Saprospiraceae bacterium]HPH54146.1 helix-turn-helix transcriptional regulator [Bacteroidales bacterium]
MEHYQIDQGIRLKKLMKVLNLNQVDFAKSVGVTQPNISKIVNGESSLSAELLARMADTYNQLNLHWLLTGSGEMFFDAVPNKNFPANEAISVSNTKERIEELKDIIEKAKRTVNQLLKDI